VRDSDLCVDDVERVSDGVGDDLFLLVIIGDFE